MKWNVSQSKCSEMARGRQPLGFVMTSRLIADHPVFKGAALHGTMRWMFNPATWREASEGPTSRSFSCVWISLDGVAIAPNRLPVGFAPLGSTLCVEVDGVDCYLHPVITSLGRSLMPDLVWVQGI